MKIRPKICLIDVIESESSSLDPPLNLVLLANYLIDRGISRKEDFKIISSAFEDAEEAVRDFEPDIIGFSVMTPFYNLALELARKLRQQTEAVFVIGGYHVSALPDSLEKPFDFGVVGEGEYTLADLVNLWEKEEIRNTQALKKIKNLVFFNKKGELVRTENGPIMNVNELPVVDWSLVSEQRVVKYMTMPVKGVFESRRMTSMYTSRGCPYSCAFCAHRALTRGERGVRNYPLNKVFDEIEYLYKQYKVDAIQILDDTFAVSKDRTKLLIEGLRERGLLGKICFYNLFVRANIIDDEFSSLLSELGASTVFVGIESGSQNVLKIIKDGPLSAEMVKKAIGCFEKNKIFVTGSFMMFSPQEKRGDMEETMELAEWFSKRKNSFALVFSVTTPYPGTKLWTEAIKDGILDGANPNWDDFMMYFMRRADKMPRVFYVPDWANDEQRYQYWKDFMGLAARVRHNLLKCKGWEQSEKLTEVRNRAIDKSWVKVKRTEQFINRIKRLYRNPIGSMEKLFQKPKIIWWVIEDLRVMLKK